MASNNRIIVLLLLLVCAAQAQLQDVAVSTADKTEMSVADLRDKLTNSKLFTTSLLWYKNARDIAKAMNRQYDLFMRGIRILNQELAFIEYMARKVERISSFQFDPNHFWESMFELESVLDQIDQIYTTDLEYFDYLIGYHRDTYSEFMSFNVPNLKESVIRTKRIWGTLPDYYTTDSKLAKMPETKIIMANEYTTAKGYQLSGTSINTINNNATSHMKNKEELDSQGHSPVKYLQFENSFYIDYMYEKCLEIDDYKQKITADCQILLSKSSFKDMNAKGIENAFSNSRDIQ